MLSIYFLIALALANASFIFATATNRDLDFGQLLQVCLLWPAMVILLVAGGITLGAAALAVLIRALVARLKARFA